MFLWRVRRKACRLLSSIRNFKSLLASSKSLFIRIWYYKYHDLKLILEQKDQLHYFQVSAGAQNAISRAFIVIVLVATLCLVFLVIHSTYMVLRYQKLETSINVTEQKRQEAIKALIDLDENSVLAKTTEHSQEDLIRAAKGYRARLNQLEALIKYSTEELKVAHQALKLGLKISGINPKYVDKVYPSELKRSGDFSGGDGLNETVNQSIKDYQESMSRLDSVKKLYYSLPTAPPVDKAIKTSKFGLRTHPITHKQSMHNGVDLVPTFVRYAMATLPGVVEKVDYSKSGYGNSVTILHNNKIRTIYAHLDSINVIEKQKVKQGFNLGKIGNTGFSTGTHLHYEVTINNEKVNPSTITAMAKYVQ